MSESSNSRDNRSIQPKKYTSQPLKLNFSALEKKLYRVDLEFRGIDHSGPSYEGRVFINNPNADQTTEKNISAGYVGSFYIFGHGRCYGDEGHCEVNKERRPYDHRPEHPLTPAVKRITITDQIKTLGTATSQFSVTIVPILAGGSKIEDGQQDLIQMEEISIITYNKEN
jgi:tyrosinase